MYNNNYFYYYVIDVDISFNFPLDFFFLPRHVRYRYNIFFLDLLKKKLKICDSYFKNLYKYLYIYSFLLFRI